MQWKSALEELVRSGAYRTQDELVHALEAEGHEVNQGTVSRALTQLGARKVGGAYRLVDGGRYGARVTNVAFTAQDCLGVVSCEPAFASVLGQAIDDASIDGVLGTVAGDDTVLVALTGTKAASRLRTWLGAPAIAR